MNFENVSFNMTDDISRFADSINALKENNIREKKKNERGRDELELLSKEKDLYNFSNNFNSNKLIPKLRRILSKKFNLTLNDYIIIIDKFKLNSENLSRDNVIELIEYLNNKSHYNQHSETIYNKENEIQASKIAALDKDEFEKNFQDMEKEREIFIKNFLLQKDLKNDDVENEINHNISLFDQNKIQDNKLDYSHKLIQNEYGNDNEVNTVNYDSMNNNELENITNEKINIDNSGIHEIDNTSNLDKNIMYENSDLFTKNENTFDHYQDNINYSDDFKSNYESAFANNKKVEAEIKDNLILDYKNLTETVEETIMFNILKYENDGNINLKINFNNEIGLKNIKEIHISDLYLNKNFCEKNNIHKSPGLIIKINELNNNFYINGSDVCGFTKIYLEKYSHFYKSIENEGKQMFTHDENFSIDNLNLEIFNINCLKYNNFIYTDNDIFNITFKIVKYI